MEKRKDGDFSHTRRCSSMDRSQVEKSKTASSFDELSSSTVLISPRFRREIVQRSPEQYYRRRCYLQTEHEEEQWTKTKYNWSNLRKTLHNNNRWRRRLHWHNGTMAAASKLSAIRLSEEAHSLCRWDSDLTLVPYRTHPSISAITHCSTVLTTDAFASHSSGPKGKGNVFRSSSETYKGDCLFNHQPISAALDRRDTHALSARFTSKKSWKHAKS